MILIGEPTSETRLGDTIKIGRRGSVNMWIEVPGHAGPRRLPAPRRQSDRRRWRGSSPSSTRWMLDEGNDAFPPSNLEFTEVLTPPGATNLIPGRGDARGSTSASTISSAAPTSSSASREVVLRQAPERDARGADLGRGVPDPAGPALRSRRRGDPRGDRDRARAVDQRRHLGRALPHRALPGGRFRPAQRDHAQGRRACRGGGHRGAGADLRADHRARRFA